MKSSCLHCVIVVGWDDNRGEGTITVNHVWVATSRPSSTVFQSRESLLRCTSSVFFRVAVLKEAKYFPAGLTQHWPLPVGQGASTAGTSGRQRSGRYTVIPASFSQRLSMSATAVRDTRGVVHPVRATSKSRGASGKNVLVRFKYVIYLLLSKRGSNRISGV